MSKSADLADLIRERTGSAPVRVGLILGSGLGHIAGAVDGIAIPYSELPGFPHAGVSGHVPQLVIGSLEGVRVAVFGGRSHYYEKGKPDAMRLPLEVLKELGAEIMVATNAAGSMRPDMPTGSVMGMRYKVLSLKPTTSASILWPSWPKISQLEPTEAMMPRASIRRPTRRTNVPQRSGRGGRV